MSDEYKGYDTNEFNMKKNKWFGRCHAQVITNGFINRTLSDMDMQTILSKIFKTYQGIFEISPSGYQHFHFEGSNDFQKRQSEILTLCRTIDPELGWWIVPYKQWMNKMGKDECHQYFTKAPGKQHGRGPFSNSQPAQPVPDHCELSNYPQLYPFQQHIILDMKEYDHLHARKPNYIANIRGAAGKTTVEGIAEEGLQIAHSIDPTVPFEKWNQYMASAIKAWGPRAGIIIDLPRTWAKGQRTKWEMLWPQVETMKTGRFKDWRNKSSKASLPKKPKIWIFSNELPHYVPPHWSNRWNFWTIDEQNRLEPLLVWKVFESQPSKKRDRRGKQIYEQVEATYISGSTADDDKVLYEPIATDDQKQDQPDQSTIVARPQ